MANSLTLIRSLATLWNVAQGDTGQSGVCRRLLLSLYNGPRFPFAVTELRRLDHELLRAAIDVLAADASHTLRAEIHEILNEAYGRRDFGHRLEHMAWALGLRGASTRRNLPELGAAPILVRPPSLPNMPAVPAPPADRASIAGAPWTGA
jgi:hypothetical protein